MHNILEVGLINAVPKWCLPQPSSSRQFARLTRVATVHSDPFQEIHTVLYSKKGSRPISP